MIQLSIVVPCYDEEEVLPETAKRLVNALQTLIDARKISDSSSVYFIDDGSKDGTWSLIELLARTEKSIRGIKLSRNRGHQHALLAGLLTAPGDALISIDADLQDDLSAIEVMLDAYAKGADIVYGVRKSRDVDSYFKRFSAESYYRLLELLNVEVVFNHADYRLMSRRALEALRGFSEANVFLRGIIPQLGFKAAIVQYDRGERFAGTSKYPFRKMLALAWDGITSFSAAPLRFITGLGFLISLASLLFTVWAIAARLSGAYTVPGWASTVIPIYFLGGIQLLAIGIMGEYLAKIYLETKKRPRFIVEKTI